jgi:hypothetical protein
MVYQVHYPTYNLGYSVRNEGKHQQLWGAPGAMMHTVSEQRPRVQYSKRDPYRDAISLNARCVQPCPLLQ